MVSSTNTISASYASKRSRSSTPPKKITLKVKTQQDGSEDIYKIGYTAHLKKLFDSYCTKRHIERGTVRFVFRRKELKPRKTPAEMMMEEGDLIDALIDTDGG